MSEKVDCRSHDLLSSASYYLSRACRTFTEPSCSVPDGKVCLNETGELAVTKFAVEPVNPPINFSGSFSNHSPGVVSSGGCREIWHWWTCLPILKILWLTFDQMRGLLEGRYSSIPEVLILS